MTWTMYFVSILFSFAAMFWWLISVNDVRVKDLALVATVSLIPFVNCCAGFVFLILRCVLWFDNFDNKSNKVVFRKWGS